MNQPLKEIFDFAKTYAWPAAKYAFPLLVGGTGITWAQFLVNRADGDTTIGNNLGNIERSRETARKLEEIMTNNPALGSVLMRDAESAYFFYRGDDNELKFEMLSMFVGEDQAVFEAVKAHMTDPAGMYDVASHRDQVSSSPDFEASARRLRSNWASPRLSKFFSFFNAAVSQQQATNINQAMISSVDELAKSTIKNKSESGPCHIAVRWTDAGGKANLIAMPTNKPESDVIKAGLRGNFHDAAHVAPVATPVAANDNVHMPRIIRAIARFNQSLISRF